MPQGPGHEQPPRPEAQQRARKGVGWGAAFGIDESLGRARTQDLARELRPEYFAWERSAARARRSERPRL